MVNLDVLSHTPIWKLQILTSQSEIKFEIMIFNNLSDFEILKKSTTVVCQQDMKDWLHAGGCTQTGIHA